MKHELHSLRAIGRAGSIAHWERPLSNVCEALHSNATLKKKTQKKPTQPISYRPKPIGKIDEARHRQVTVSTLVLLLCVLATLHK